MTRLSAEQEAACTPLEGPVRVLAGAGTGKTTVIAERYRRLLAAGVAPGSILVMTFTERAAVEMRERIMSLAPGVEPSAVGTFHALALARLREDGGEVGLRPGFRVLTGPDRWIALRELMWELGDEVLIGAERPDDLVASLLRLQERLKQELVPVERLAAFAGRDPDQERGRLLGAAARLYRLHADRCRRRGLVDFDDLIALLARLLDERPAVRERLASRFPWIMVDEYQDTNLAQERVIEQLGGQGGNVCVVGDDDQAIYRFRGASRASLERFQAWFPEAPTVALTRNRRSPGRLVRAAAALAAGNPERVPKPLLPHRALGPGEPVEVWGAADGEAEAGAIVAEIVGLVNAGTAPREIAILVRAHALARPLLAALVAAGVPYRYRGGRGLYRRPEILDLVAYLHLLDDPADLLALARVVVRPPLGLDLAEVLSVLRSAQVAAPEALRGWPPSAAWAELMTELWLARQRLGVDELLFELLERTRYLDAAMAAEPAEGQRIAFNVSRFVDLVAEYCEQRRDHSLHLFVEYVDLVLRSGVDEEEAELESAPDAVQLLTIHQAKGLEFDVVFMPAAVEGRLPQPHRSEGPDLPPQLVEASVRGREDQVAEERRLAYVAVTRARRRLVLSWARRYEGPRPWRRSRFLEELGPGIVRREVPSAAPREPPAPAPAALSPRPIPESDSVTLSYSGISAYRECPRQYWFRHRLRLPAEPAVEAQFGTVLHLALLRAGRVRQRGAAPSRRELSELYREAWDEVGLAEPRRRPALEALGWTLLERYVEAGGLAPEPLLLEAPFTTEVDNWTLRGIIDRVDRLPPPTQEGGGWAKADPLDFAPRAGSGAAGSVDRAVYRIVDYKTGRPRPAAQLRRDLQLALYALGARAALGFPAAGGWMELEIVHLRNGESLVLEAGPALLDEARRIGGEVAEGIRRQNFEARPERRRCALCAYRLACDSAM